MISATDQSELSIPESSVINILFKNCRSYTTVQKFGIRDLLMFLKEVFCAHEDYIYVIKNTYILWRGQYFFVGTVIL